MSKQTTITKISDSERFRSRTLFPIIDWTKLELRIDTGCSAYRRDSLMYVNSNEWAAFDLNDIKKSTDPFIAHGGNKFGEGWDEEVLYDFTKDERYGIANVRDNYDVHHANRKATRGAWFMSKECKEHRKDIHYVGSIHYSRLPPKIKTKIEDMDRPVIVRHHCRIVNQNYHQFFYYGGARNKTPLPKWNGVHWY